MVNPAPTTARTALRTAWDSATSAATFFGRRYPVVFVFGAAASTQRAVSVLYADVLSTPAQVAGEVFTAAVRIVFLGWLVRTLIIAEPGLRTQVGARLSAFARRHWPVLLAHLALLSIATLVFNNLLEGVGPALLAEDQQPKFWAWLLAIKNVTIIPFTMIWLVVMIRDALRTAVVAPAAESVH